MPPPPPPPPVGAELTNEWDVPYATEMGVDGTLQLAAIVTATARAIRGNLTGSGVSVGCVGPAWNRPDIMDNVVPFINATAGQLDAYSYHAYCTGSTGTANSSIWACAAGPYEEGEMWPAIKAVWPPGSLPLLFRDEQNISWDPPDSRQWTGVGAVFDALALTQGLLVGATSVARWNLMDGWYGAIDGSFNIRPPGYLWGAMSRLLYGVPVATSAAPFPDNLTPFAVYDATTGAALVALMNRAGAPLNVSLQATRWPGGSTPPAGTPIAGLIVDDAGVTNTTGLTVGTVFDPASQWLLPQDGVLMLSFTL
jgi:hypothetical protein